MPNVNMFKGDAARAIDEWYATGDIAAGPGTAGVGHGRGAGHGIAPRLRGLVRTGGLSCLPQLRG